MEEPEKRLDNSENGINEIKSHPLLKIMKMRIIYDYINNELILIFSL